MQQQRNPTFSGINSIKCIVAESERSDRGQSQEAATIITNTKNLLSPNFF